MMWYEITSEITKLNSEKLVTILVKRPRTKAFGWFRKNFLFGAWFAPYPFYAT